jgi:hypothetical protein
MSTRRLRNSATRFSSAPNHGALSSGAHRLSTARPPSKFRLRGLQARSKSSGSLAILEAIAAVLHSTTAPIITPNRSLWSNPDASLRRVQLISWALHPGMAPFATNIKGCATPMQLAGVLLFSD